MNNQQQGYMGSGNHPWPAGGAGESSKPFGTTPLYPRAVAFQPRSPTSPSQWQLDNYTSYRPTTRPHSPYPHGGSMPSEIHYFPSHDSEGMDQSGRLMTHPNGGSFNPYMNAYLNAQPPRGPQGTMAQPVNAVIPNLQKACTLCLEKFDISDFLHKCHRCSGGNICVECLKDWFIDACRNESKMPPKCCSIIPLATISSHMTKDQVELFAAKYEEWQTPDRIYCPIKTCSTFIRRKLYVKKSAFGHKAIILPHVDCPKCSTAICTQCRSTSHIGDCPPSDLDPEVEAALKRFRWKRCPKCRTGIKKVFGCSHVECRCGAHFCFECLLPMSECDGSCEESDDNRDEEDYELDDFDGRAGYYEGDGHDFGPEPYETATDGWGCPHEWTLVQPATVAPGETMECNRCLRTFQPPFEVQKEVNPDPDGDTPMGGMPDFELRNYYGIPAWVCYNGHMSCRRCPKVAPPHRIADVSWLWSCDCGQSCNECDKDKLKAVGKFEEDQRLDALRKKIEDRMVWECTRRCGLYVCGACRAAGTEND